ncbi:hypothetical protein KHS38_09455 [Mucilaginibacter sp. Bleaf8]|uniref:hypothetical protein n=1 Tax=Mucilaginibacter sp. Bleaf8 TaxID=2834430 RepID=UPI001BCCA608|nr:hypothetical protein [Mucilaginibacter sp. Bleaf8]MBS7564632.1 hypothetical protein [Mucilaginibacter sp. Bleaf8]
MPKDDLPTYAIVELLIRLSEFNAQIGNYKDHSTHDGGVVVLTSRGHINFPRSIVMQQFNDPEMITRGELLSIADTFKKA